MQAPNAVIAACWTDLIVDSKANITEGDYWDGSAGYFVIIWNNVLPKDCGDGQRLTFEIALQEWTGYEGKESPIYICYKQVAAITHSFAYGIEDQMGHKGTGQVLAGSVLMSLYGKVKRFWENVDNMFLKNIYIEFQDDCSQSELDIANDQHRFMRGSHLATGVAPQPDSLKSFEENLYSLASTAYGIYNVAVHVEDYMYGLSELVALTQDVPEIGLFVSVGMLAWGFYDAFSKGQYDKVAEAVTWANSTQTHAPYAYVKAPVNGSNIRDASLDLYLDWYLEDNPAQNHTLTVKATAEYGYYQSMASRNVSTTQSIKMYTETVHNKFETAQSIEWGNYSWLWTNSMTERSDYFKIFVPSWKSITATVVPVTYGSEYNLYLYQDAVPPRPVAWSHNQVYGEEKSPDGGYWYICVNISIYWGFYNLSVTMGDARRTLTIASGEGGTTWPSPEQHSYPYGKPVDVYAIPYCALGYIFGYWTLDGIVHYDNPITVTMTADHWLTAYFHKPTLTITVLGMGSTVPSSPGAYPYDFGTNATVSATPSGGYYFALWRIDGVGGTISYVNPITLNMTADHTLEAFFEQNIPGGPGGGCPFVSTWNGTGYALDNNILPASEIGNGTDTKDHYLLQQPVVPLLSTRQASLYSLQISEFENEHDYIDQVKLLAVDHSQGTCIAVTPEGRIVTYTNPASPLSCVDNNSNNLVDAVSGMDGNVSNPATYFQGYDGSWLLLNFGRVTAANAKLILRDDQKCSEDRCIDVQVLRPGGGWQTVEVLTPRDFWAVEAVNMTAYVPADGDFIVRLLWTAPHRLDYVGLDTSAPAQVRVSSAQPALAVHSTLGDVKGKLLYDDEHFAELVNGQRITMAFILPNPAQGTSRDFILYTNGYYYTIKP